MKFSFKESLLKIVGKLSFDLEIYLTTGTFKLELLNTYKYFQLSNLLQGFDQKVLE